MWIKIQEGYLGSEESQVHMRSPSLGFQCQEDKSPQLLAAETSRDWAGRRNFWSSKQFPLKNSHMDSLRLILSELQHQDSSLKGTTGIQGGTEVSGIKAGAERQYSPDRNVGKGYCPFSEPSPHRTTELAVRCHIWDSNNLANTVWPSLEVSRSCPPPNLWAHPSCFAIRMAGLGS